MNTTNSSPTQYGVSRTSGPRDAAPVEAYASDMGREGIKKSHTLQPTKPAGEPQIRPAAEALRGHDNKSLIAHWMQGAQLDSATIKMLEKSIIPEGTPQQINYFLIMCRIYGLNPFRKEIYAWPSREAVDAKNMMLTICISRDGLLHRAQQSPHFAGLHSSDVRENDHYCIRPAQGEIVHEITKAIADRGKVIGGYAAVGRWNSRQEQILWSIAWADLSKYSRNTTVWRTHEAGMITKVAESKALKKAFGLPGLGVEDDFYVDSRGVSHAIPDNGAEAHGNGRLERVLA